VREQGMKHSAPNFSLWPTYYITTLYDTALHSITLHRALHMTALHTKPLHTNRLTPYILKSYNENPAGAMLQKH